MSGCTHYFYGTFFIFRHRVCYAVFRTFVPKCFDLCDECPVSSGGHVLWNEWIESTSSPSMSHLCAWQFICEGGKKSLHPIPDHFWVGLSAPGPHRGTEYHDRTRSPTATVPLTSSRAGKDKPKQKGAEDACIVLTRHLHPVLFLLWIVAHKPFL